MSTSTIPVTISTFTGRHIPAPVNRLASGFDIAFNQRRSLGTVTGDPYTPKLTSLGVPVKGTTVRSGGVSVYLPLEVVASEAALTKAKITTLAVLKEIFGRDFTEVGDRE